MPAFDFPSSPTDGQTFTPPGTTITYTYNLAGAVWKAASASTASAATGTITIVSASDPDPTRGKDGDFWIKVV